MKRNDYATMTLAQVESYFKLLKNIKETPPRRSGNDHRMSTTAPSTNCGNGGSNRSGNSGNGDCGRSRGNNRQGNCGGGRRTNNQTNQAPAQHQIRRSNRTRGPYCPHHRTNDHDGSTCPDYQQYICTRNTGNQEANAIAERCGNRSTRTENPNEALVIEDNEEEAYMAILKEEGEDDALIYPWSDSDDDDVPDEQPSIQEPFAPDDAPSSSRFVPDDAPSSAHFDNEDDDESFVPEDHRDYSTAPRLPIPPGPHAFISLSDRMDDQCAVDQAEDEHEEAEAIWPHTYDTYLRHYAQWCDEYPRPSRSDKLAVTRDDDESDLFREFVTDVVALLPVEEEDRNAWVFNV
jgi:uncharacterized low-complexity protein